MTQLLEKVRYIDEWKFPGKILKKFKIELKLILIFILYHLMTLNLGAEEFPLTCGMGDMAGLRDKRLVVQCEAKIRITVTDAKINHGKCESPVSYQKKINSYHKQAGLPSFADLKDFRKIYIAGETFYFAIPENCSVESYTLVVDDREYTWDIK